MNAIVTSAAEEKILSFSDLTIRNRNAAFHLLRNGWLFHRLDAVQSWSVLLLDDHCRACGVIDLPLHQKMVTERDAQHLVTLIARENAASFVLAQNKRHGVLLSTAQERDFIRLLSGTGNDENLALLDYFLINKLGYYSHGEDEYRVCPSLYFGM